MKSKKTMSITEIQDKYEKTVKYRRLLIIVGSISIILTIILLIVNASPELTDYRKYVPIPFFVSFLLFLSIAFKIPNMSTYEEMRYHLSKLIENLNIKNYKKSEYYLDKLAFNLDLFLEELEDIFLLNYVREFAQNFLFMLKYDIFPDISNKDKIGGFLTNLENIENALSNEDFTFLIHITNNLKNEKLMRDKITFPYEKPSLFNHIATIFTNIINYYPIKYFIVYICILSLLSGIGYYFSTRLSFLTFDSGLIAALLVVSTVFTEKIKIK